jgi:hypothetical protein
VPQVPVFGTWVLGLPFLPVEIADAGRTQTNLWQGPSPFYYVQLLQKAAAFSHLAKRGRIGLNYRNLAE